MKKYAISLMFFLIFISQIVVASEGYLEIRVEDCSTERRIEDAKVKVTARIDPIDYTDSYGYAYFILDPDTYTVEVSKSGYYSESITARVYVDETTHKTICLDSIDQVCEIDLVDKEISDKNVYRGEEIEVFIKLRMTYDGIDPTAEVTVSLERIIDPKITKTFHFYYSGDTDERIFVFDTEDLSIGRYDVYVKAEGENDCGRLSKTLVGTIEIMYDNPGYKRHNPSCKEGYLNRFRCVDGNKQQLYQSSDCSEGWITVEGISYDCSRERYVPPKDQIAADGIDQKTEVLLQPIYIESVNAPCDYNLISYSLILISVVLIVIFMSVKLPIFKFKDSRKIPESF